MVRFLFEAAWSGWALAAVAIIGFLVGRMHSGVRWACLLAVGLVPVVMMFAGGAIEGCNPLGARECGVEDGVAYAGLIGVWWIAAAAMGMAVRHVLSRPWDDPS